MSARIFSRVDMRKLTNKKVSRPWVIYFLITKSLCEWSNNGVDYALRWLNSRRNVTMVITLATKPTMDDIALNISIGAPFYQRSLDLREAFTKPSFKNFYSHGTLEFAFYHFYV